MPALVGEGADLAAETTEQARQNALEATSTINEEMDIEDEPAHNSYTTMAVVDGIVIPSSVCYLLLNYFIKINGDYIALCL